MNNKQKVLKHYGANITDVWNNVDQVDMVFESVYTADSYNVYWMHEPSDMAFNPESIFYYASSCSDDIKNCIKDGLSLFVDSEIYDECYFDDEFEDMWDDIKNERDSPFVSYHENKK